MVARAGAKLRHVAPTHPAARRCGSLNAPASPPSPPQTSRQAEAALRAGRHRRTSRPAGSYWGLVDERLIIALKKIVHSGYIFFNAHGGDF